MLSLMLKTLWLMLPGIFANMAPVLARPYFKNLAFPLDGNRKLNNKPILGKNKTFRGLLAAIVASLIVAFIQSLLYNFEAFRNLSIVNYQIQWIQIGFLFGFGMILGDAIGSFIKRRLSIPSGKPFPILDQLDAPLVVLLIIYPFYKIPFEIIVAGLFLALFLHFLIRLISYMLKITEEPW